MTKQSQPCKGPQDCYRTFKAISNSITPPTGHELREQSAHSRKDGHNVTDKESHLRNNKEPCFGRIDSKCIVGSHWRSNHKSVESSSMMRTVKQTQARQTSSKQNSSDRNDTLKRKDECMGKQEEMALPKTHDWTTRGKCKMKKWKPEQTKCSEMCLTYGKSRDKVINREAHEDSIVTNAESDANKRPWKNLTAQRMWDWPEIFVVDDGWQDFRSKTLVDTTQVLEEKMHMVMSEHLIMQTEETLDYPMTETRKEHRSLAFASNNETSGEMSVQLEVLQEMAEVSTVLQKVQQRKLFQVTMFYAVTLLLEEGNKYHELNKSYGFVNEQQFALHENLNETAMHRRLCHGAVKHDKPWKAMPEMEHEP